MKNALVNATLVVVSTAISFLALEAAYRYSLYRRAPAQFIQTQSQPDSVTFFNQSIWTFDRELGFQYRPDVRLLVGTLEGGRLAGCRPVEINNRALHDGRRAYAGADIKVLVFGDSVTAMTVDGRSWPDDLQDRLERRLGRKVSVLNLGLDGIGILQMFDIAARRIAELKPDLAIVAFISDDVTRDRIWRTTAVVDRRLRQFTTTRPQETPDLEFAADTVVVSPGVTPQWCARQPPPDRTDPVVQDIEHRYLLAVKLAANRADLYALDHSFAIDRLVLGTPFRQLVRPNKGAVNPRHQMTDFAQDERMRGNVAAVQAGSTPLFLFHLAIRSELRLGKEYLFANESRERALLASLEKLAGVRVALTTQHLKLPVKDVEAMGITPTDDHPSLYGMQLYADAVADALLRHGVLRAGGVKP